MRSISLLTLLLLCCSVADAQSLPDIGTTEPDLMVPEMTVGEPSAGKRVKQVLPDYDETDAYHVLYLPTDWKPGRTYPVIVEFAGNGPYKNAFGDISTGHPEHSRLGYGISAGEGVIWVCMPYLSADGTRNVTRWWGDAPEYDARPTVEYCKKAVPWICEQYGGDPDRVILAGFSRGAIACNFIGLYDDEIAKLWRAFIPYSHYDGVRRWPYPCSDRDSAIQRLSRLDSRPQFICHEGSGVDATKTYLESTGVNAPFTFQPTGFRNHNDAWTLRPSPTREKLRAWVEGVLE